MNRPTRLSAVFVRKATRPGRYGDGFGGHGLSLLVKERAHGGVAKSWSQRLRVSGRVRNIGLGPFPIVSLADARKAAIENARMAWQGQDPKASRAPTMEQAAETVIEFRATTWRNPLTAEIWRSSFQRFVFPVIGDKPVSEVTTADALSVLAPLWATKRETGRRMRQRIGAVMQWAVAHGYRTDDPCGSAIAAALPRNATAPKQHHRALAPSAVPDAVAKVRASSAWPATKLLLEFIIHTAVRSGEARLATWDEIDLTARVWTVPAERMKSGKVHRVPLSNRALALLAEAVKLADGSGMVFPSATGKALSNMTTSKLLRETDIDATTHGFRTSFRSWCAEQNEPREIAEAALAHVVPGVEGAYMRSDLFERRRTLMQEWSDYIGA